MQQKVHSVFNLAVIVGALGYFVDIYDLLLFSIIRVPSLKSLGLDEAAIAREGLNIINIQMLGLLIGGIIWGILGDKKGRLKVLFATILLYSIGNIANGFVTNVHQYALVRFISGVGLAGELGAGITLVSELLPKEKRGIGASIISGVGVIGAVAAFFVKEKFDWRTCYFIGGGLGIALLLLRAGVLESGMYKDIKHQKISKGNFFMLFTDLSRLRKYVATILIGLPVWYIIGILITFSKEFGAKMDVRGTVDPGKAVMYCYAAISIGNFLAGYLSQWLQSRKKVVYLYYFVSIAGLIWFFDLHHAGVNQVYLVSIVLGIGGGFWTTFVTMAAEQFGTNIRATVTTTAPNMVRGSLIPISLLFVALQPLTGYVRSGWITGIVVMLISFVALYFVEETYNKDLNYLEE
ncbi:MAG: MFS transporter [Bacteroidetes bacterium]|nr:MFS transporter [Bacteroidota bacterium]MBS1973185.1 MFS transporter [Bacteroidota bacterium]